MKTSVVRIGALVTACLAVAVPAYAEGSFTSTVTGVYGGFSSRTWVDKNLDSAANYAKIFNCSRGATLAIYRNRQWPVPDEVVGSEKATCNSQVPYNAGTKGDIHFTVVSTQNGGSLTGDVKVGY